MSQLILKWCVYLINNPRNRINFYKTGHNVLEIEKVLIQVWIAKSKTELDI